MAVFITSDHHLGHRLVAGKRWEAIHGKNPNALILPDEQLVKWHSDMLASRWDETITKNDKVIIAGDLTIGERDVTDALQWLAARPFSSLEFVPGNHDPCHPMHSEAPKWQRRYMELFNSVQLAYSHKMVIVPGEKKRKILISHMPYDGDHTPEDRYEQWRLRDEGEWLLHGHTHSTDRLTFPRWRDNTSGQIHIGLDAWDFRPVPMDKIAEMIREAEEQWPTSV